MNFYTLKNYGLKLLIALSAINITYDVGVVLRSVKAIRSAEHILVVLDACLSAAWFTLVLVLLGLLALKED